MFLACPDSVLVAVVRGEWCRGTMPSPPESKTTISAETQPLSLFPAVRDFALHVGAAVAIQTMVFQPFTIPSASMEPGLLVGDYLIVSKFAYGWSRASLPLDPPLREGRLSGRLPDRGDVVVFRRPSSPSDVWIKRVIALPGDHIEIRNGLVIVNGLPLPQTRHGPGLDPDAPLRTVQRVEERQPSGRRYVTFDLGSGQAGDSRAPEVVPEGYLFVMGDHRDNSLDSRWPEEVGVGLLPVENLVGRAEIVVASWHPGAALLKPWTWSDLRSGRFLQRVR